jgi:hypothetical protein
MRHIAQLSGVFPVVVYHVLQQRLEFGPIAAAVVAVGMFTLMDVFMTRAMLVAVFMLMAVFVFVAVSMFMGVFVAVFMFVAMDMIMSMTMGVGMFVSMDMIIRHTITPNKNLKTGIDS